jgi:hypothetical protein
MIRTKDAWLACIEFESSSPTPNPMFFDRGGWCICDRRVVVDTQRLMMQAHAGIGSVSSPAAA